MLQILRRARNRHARRLRATRRLDQPAYQVGITEARSILESSELGRLVLAHTGAPVMKWAHYLGAYSEQLSRYRAQPVRFLEIGVFKGGSLQLWREFLAPNSVISGLDINPACQDLTTANARIYIGSQTDDGLLRQIVDNMGGIDVVVDDGSHVAFDQRTAFETLFPLLSDDGIYVVEDVHTSYWPDYGGGYHSRKSFLGYTKRILDDMHAWYHTKGERTWPDARHSIDSITFYDSLVFIRKKPHDRPVNFLTK